ncbi:primosomal protein N' [Neptuniibacter caesariensis]|uniref:Replication restart protein PriA n=1 Tax=Neptuniibacter caesariensis TaxID=207954 RepID=A0A7U8C4K1_NEPCE|nr:primosomal protein N' [Neptuniibacter caesariensis]EAR61425.1 primosome assembly protein PriA [Oceanospirillum sp. MED92] [Neptuniibacter caesariensis]
MSILRLAIPSPLRRLFDYLPPEGISVENLQPGIRVIAPFGRREVIGVLIEVAEESEFSLNKLKRVKSLLDNSPPLPQHLFKLARWAASYYQHPEGDAIQQALPVLLRKGNACEFQHETLWRASETASTDQLKANAIRQIELLQLLLEHPQGISTDALKAEGANISALSSLAEKGLAESFQRKHSHHDEQILHEAPLTLNSEQQLCIEHINGQHEFAINLLEGVTGSGKTEVYLQAIEKVLRQGKQALVLVPEIGLTPQTVSRFKQRFSVPIVALHSNMTDRQRLDAWLQAREGIARIIIGTRSAIFTPMKAPGIIIIDEEHDASFKQQDGFRYSARDLSVMRARDEKIPVILGSATPSLETLHNAIEGRYHWLRMTQRAGNSAPPEFKLLDIRQENLSEGLSAPLINAIRKHLESGTQVLVFLNRRGYSPTLTCHDCGWIADCNRCDAHMTLHQRPPHLHCHHCDKQAAIPQRCPECNSDQLQPVGVGTERSEQALKAMFPDFPVIRVDRDSTQRKNAMQEIMHKVNTGDPCILVGTQMLAKGHHFPKVTLVAILNADSGLFSADFRGMERTAQLILQVAGRAGRADHPGKVLMQTYHADHPTLQTLVNHGYCAFAQEELHNRKMAQLPPYTHYALLRAETSTQGRAESFLAAIRQQLEDDMLLPHDASWIGPFPSPMEKRAGMHRAQLMIYAENRKSLHQLLANLCWYLEQNKESRKVRWSIDVDPADTF